MLCTVLAGCSSAFDKTPITGAEAFGIPFRATLEGVYIARVTGSSVAEYRDIAAVAARYPFVGADPLGISASLLRDLATGIAQVTVSDTERRLASARCIYVLKPENKSLAAGIRNNALTVSNADDPDVAGGTDDSSDDVGLSNGNADDGARRRADRKSIAESGGRPGEEDDGGELISLIQICNADLRFGDEVMVTLTSGVGTIHPSMSSASKTVGDVMRRRNVLPPKAADEPAPVGALP